MPERNEDDALFEELGRSWRDAAMPPPRSGDLADEDRTTRHVVAWMQSAWRALPVATPTEACSDSSPAAPSGDRAAAPRQAPAPTEAGVAGRTAQPLRGRLPAFRAARRSVAAAAVVLIAIGALVFRAPFRRADVTGGGAPDSPVAEAPPAPGPRASLVPVPASLTPDGGLELRSGRVRLLLVQAPPRRFGEAP